METTVKKFLGWVTLAMILWWGLKNPETVASLIHQIRYAVATIAGAL